MQRLLVSIALFSVSAAVFVAISLVLAFRRVSEREATGIGFVLGSRAENLVRLVIMVLLAIFAYWMSGKLLHK
jgi:hypothetical protein